MESLIDAGTAAAWRGLDAAAAAPMNPLTVALAVAAGLVLGMVALRLLTALMPLVSKVLLGGSAAAMTRAHSHAPWLKKVPVAGGSQARKYWAAQRATKRAVP